MWHRTFGYTWRRVFAVSHDTTWACLQERCGATRTYGCLARVTDYGRMLVNKAGHMDVDAGAYADGRDTTGIRPRHGREREQRMGGVWA